MNAGSQRGLNSDINNTPYIDILLVLLIIFMIVTPAHQYELRAKAPQPPPPKPIVAAPSDAIAASTGDSAQIAINQMPTEISVLGAKLRGIFNARPNKSLFISASSTLSYGDVVKVIDISKGAGVGDIGLLTREIR